MTGHKRALLLLGASFLAQSLANGQIFVQFVETELGTTVTVTGSINDIGVGNASESFDYAPHGWITPSSFFASNNTGYWIWSTTDSSWSDSNPFSDLSGTFNSENYITGSNSFGVNFDSSIGLPIGYSSGNEISSSMDFSESLTDMGLDTSFDSTYTFKVDGTGVVEYSTIRFATVAVPEPSAFAFLAGGLALFVAARTRKRAK